MTMTSSINGKSGRMLSHAARRFAFFGISAILLLSLLSIQGNQSVWAGTFPGPNGQIAFTSFRDGNAEIYVMNADGSDVTRLTDDPAPDTNPSWSSDGTKIAFNRELEDVNFEIYVMNADDGSDVTRLTDNDANDFHPDWGTNTSSPGDDGDDHKNEHDDDKKKHHDDDAKKKH